MNIVKYMKLPTLNGRLLLKCPKIEDWTVSSTDMMPIEDLSIANSPDEAHMVVSATGKGTHKPTLDIDLPCILEQSATPGKFHLFIDKELSEKDYDKLLHVLLEVGIIEKGVIDLQWTKSRFTAKPEPMCAVWCSVLAVMRRNVCPPCSTSR